MCSNENCIGAKVPWHSRYRTLAILDQFRGKPSEIVSLQAVLSLSFEWSLNEQLLWRKFIDNRMIALRINDLQKQAREIRERRRK